tara:strand:- start:101 stop:880 length:780 start_codon:yes stop_codon:yes gene_type:complete
MKTINNLLNKISYKENYIRSSKIAKEIIDFRLKQICIKKNFKVRDINRIYEIILDLLGTSTLEGLEIVDSLIRTRKLNGDVCEFGVAQGKTSKLIAYLIKNTNKKLYLFDSFKGLPRPSKEDVLIDDIFNLGDMKAYQGTMSHAKHKVLNELAKIKFNQKKFIINEGFFNQSSLNKFSFPKKISFAYIDFDFYQPILDALKSLENRLMLKGIIIVDDYDHFSSGVKKAVDYWLKNKKKLFEVTKYKTTESSFIKLLKNG